MTIKAWAQGNVYHGTSSKPTFVQHSIPAPYKNPSLLGPDGKIVSKTHPQYEDLDVSSFISARDFGAVGDGVTDDTKALQSIFDTVSETITLLKFSSVILIVPNSSGVARSFSSMQGSTWSRTP